MIILTAKQKIMEDMVAFGYLIEPQDLFQKMTVYEMDPEVMKLGREFLTLVTQSSSKAKEVFGSLGL